MSLSAKVLEKASSLAKSYSRFITIEPCSSSQRESSEGLELLEETMCIVCERELWGEHRALEREFFKPCKKCKKFPGASTQGTCYHCFAVGSTIDECPECAGKPWSEDFLEAKEEIEGPDQPLVPF